MAAIAITIVGAIIGYNLSVEQTKQKGLKFGNELEQIQGDVKNLQTKFYSEKTRWEEGDITKEELLRYFDEHLRNFKEIISRYDKLEPPELFKSSVELLKLSSQAQLESDSEYITWIKTGDNAAKVRSDAQFQEALEYEMTGLVEFYSAKTGVKNYDEPEQFQEPQNSISQKVLEVTENKKIQCEEEFKNDGVFESDQAERDWYNCINDAEKWKTEHLP